MTLFFPFLIAAVLPAQVAKAPAKIEGERHMLVLFSDGFVGGWGDPRDGSLGSREASPNFRGQAAASVPIAVPRPAMNIAAGRSHLVRPARRRHRPRVR